MNQKRLYFIIILFFVLLLITCDNDTSPTIIGSWTKTGGNIITFHNSGAVTTNNFGTGIYENGKITLSAGGNTGIGSYYLSGTKLIISDFVRVGISNFDSLNGEWLKLD